MSDDERRVEDKEHVVQDELTPVVEMRVQVDRPLESAREEVEEEERGLGA